MRRSQLDKTSQPVRNLAGNPGFNYSNTTQINRTNRLLNPLFEASTGTTTIRTNLATDPRGVFNTSGYGAQTITPNVSISGNPDGLTTATRVSYTSTDVNPGLVILNPTTSGVQYTMSAWIYHETIPAAGSQGFAEAGVVSMASPPAFVQGVWQRISWTRTSTGSYFGYRVSSQTTSGSFLITGVLIETTPVLGSFFDGANPAATRTNLIPSPTAANSNGWFQAVNSPATFTTNNAGGPLGTPYARLTINTPGTGLNYFAVAQGSTNPAHWTPATPGKTYTISAYVRATMVNYQQPKIRLRWKNAAGTTISDEPLVSATGTTSGQWVRISSTGTAPAGTVYIELMGGFVSLDQATLTAGDTVDVSAALAEEGSTLGSYFDGATSAGIGMSYAWRGTANASISYATDSDFTYGWTGTANASTSYQRGTNAQFWSGATGAGVYQTSTSPLSGAKSCAVVTKGQNGDGVFASDIAVVAGTSYTWSAWIKASSVHALHGSLRWKTSGQVIIYDDILDVSPTLVVGSWVRVSMTAVAPATATLLQPMWRILASHTATTYYIDQGMLEDSPVLGSYFDGGSVDAGDFIYDWSGAAHISTSVMKTNVIPWSIASKSSAVLDAKFYSWQSTAEDGVKTLKFYTPAGTANSSWRVAQISGASTQGWDISKVKAGNTYTFWMRYRSSGWGSGQTFQMQIADGTNLNPVITNTSPITLNQNGWQELRRTFTAIRDATTASQIYMALPTTPQTATDGIFELREWMLVEGEYSGDYIDGSKPFSKWDGTANQSSSVGYPQELIDFAGTPRFDGTDLAMGSTYTVPAGPVTIYTVQNIQQATGNPGYWEFSINGGGYGAGNGIARLIGSLPTQARLDQMKTDNTSVNTSVTLDPLNLVVTATAIDSPATATEFQGNGGTTVTIPTNTFRGNVGGIVKIGVRDNGLIGTVITKRVLIYLGKHDQSTRQAISRYLGNKHGANVA